MSLSDHPTRDGFDLKRFWAITAVILLIGYGLFNAKHLITGPSIEILSPATEEAETGNDIFTIKGRAQNITFLSLNGRQIFIDTEGFFEEKLLLSEGFNIITLVARDRFKKETVKTVKIYYKPPNDGESLDNI